MTFRRFSTQTLVAAALLLSGCRDREVVSYRIPRDTHAPAEKAKSAKAAPAAQGQLPDGHPPIGGAPSTSAPADGGAAMAAAGLPAGAVSKNNALVWAAPANWQERAAGSIRKGSYTVPGEGGAVGDLSITAFPGDTGGLHANVNRWRGQIGLAPISDAEVEKSITHVDANGLHLEFVEMVGTTGNPPMRLLGAIVPYEKETWFFKLTGPDPLVASQREAFRTFLTTIKVR